VPFKGVELRSEKCLQGKAYRSSEETFNATLTRSITLVTYERNIFPPNQIVSDKINYRLGFSFESSLHQHDWLTQTL